jgi:hypothetical protein
MACHKCSAKRQNRGDFMPYTADITRSNPTALLFLVDQSASMGETMAGAQRTKSEFVSDALNRTLSNLIVASAKAEGIRHYFDVGVLGYGGTGTRNGFAAPLDETVLNPITKIAENPLRQEMRWKRFDDGAGGIVEQQVKFPLWFEPKADGGTPMCAALSAAAVELSDWCDSHQDSYPPTILHITDGESTDGPPEELAGVLQQFHTNDGRALLFNLHVSSNAGHAISYPTSDSGLPDVYAQLLYRMSSLLPTHLASFAQSRGFKVSSESRGFMFNGEASEVVNFFDIGTRPSQLR